MIRVSKNSLDTKMTVAKQSCMSFPLHGRYQYFCPTNKITINRLFNNKTIILNSSVHSVTPSAAMDVSYIDVMRI